MRVRKRSCSEVLPTYYMSSKKCTCFSSTRRSTLRVKRVTHKRWLGAAECWSKFSCCVAQKLMQHRSEVSSFSARKPFSGVFRRASQKYQSDASLRSVQSKLTLRSLSSKCCSRMFQWQVSLSWVDEEYEQELCIGPFLVYGSDTIVASHSKIPHMCLKGPRAKGW